MVYHHFRTHPRVGTPPKAQKFHILLYTFQFLHDTFVCCKVERMKTVQYFLRY
jgi:hypothetical protein